MTDLIDKEKVRRASDEVIDVLRKKHKLSIIECAFCLDCLVASLKKTACIDFERIEKELAEDTKP